MDDVVASACDQMGLDGGDACLVQHAANALFRLSRAGVMLRLSPQPVERMVRVTRELSAAGVPVADLASGVPQPVAAGSWWATAWTLYPVLAERLPAAALAVPLTALHEVQLFGLPRWNLTAAIREFLTPLAKADSTWSREHLGLSMSRLIGLLLARCDEIERELPRVTWTLPAGTIHGDAHTGNLLRTAAGRVLLCDLDTVATGPRETDLVPVAHGVARFGRDHGDYQSFVDQYGFDLLGAPSWPTLHRLRDLQMAIYMLPRPPADPISTGELAHRLRTVLNGDDGAQWNRYPAFF